MSFRAYDLLKLVKDFGETLTLKQLSTKGTYNTATGTVAGSVETPTAFVGYLYDYSDFNTDVIRGTRRCVIPALGFAPEPSPDDVISGNNDTVKVSRVRTIWSNGVAICYLCDVRE